MSLSARLLGAGSYLPAHIMTNADFPAELETSDAWIRERTGITQRHIAAKGEKTSDLAITAARNALERAGLSGTDVDLIILATATPDNTFPATAVKVQAALGAGGAAFDIQAVCSGFIFAMATADAYLRGGLARTALVIGAETFSRILDWQDRTTCVLFGDGAGAVILQANETSDGKGILASAIHSDGQHHDLLYVDGGPSSTGTVGHVRMKGREVFKHAVTKLSGAVEEVCVQAGVAVSDIDWIVPHQANKRILDGTAKKLNFPSDRIIVTVDKHANTSAASVPLALTHGIEDGRIKPGDLVLMEGMGGGFTWGACLVRL